MADDPQTTSKPANKRKAAQERRAAKAELCEICFEALAAGWTVQQIAEMRKVSVRTVQREIARAIDNRRLDAPDRFVHLQVARLTKVLRLADSRLNRGDLAAAGTFMKAVAALDRYHGLNRPPLPASAAPRAIEQLTASPPPLALTFAGPPEDADEATEPPASPRPQEDSVS